MGLYVYQDNLDKRDIHMNHKYTNPNQQGIPSHSTYI